MLEIDYKEAFIKVQKALYMEAHAVVMGWASYDEYDWAELKLNTEKVLYELGFTQEDILELERSSEQYYTDWNKDEFFQRFNN